MGSLIFKVFLLLLGIFLLYLGYSALTQPGFADSKVVIGSNVYTPRMGIYLLLLKGVVVIAAAMYWWYKDTRK